METVIKTSVTNGYSRIATRDSTVYFNVGFADFTFTDLRKGRRFERLIGSGRTANYAGTRHVVRVDEADVLTAMRIWVSIVQGTS